MAAKTAPNVGETYLENALRYQQVVFGDSANADVDISCVSAPYDDSTGTEEVNVFTWGPGGIQIFGVSARVVNAFEAGAIISLGTDSNASASAGAYWLSTDKVAATVPETQRLSASWTSMDTGGSATDTVMTPLFSSATGALQLIYQPGTSVGVGTGVLEIGIWYAYGY